jgi:antitoxin component YwqK of YwqJK toxin-antitoxin module
METKQLILSFVIFLLSGCVEKNAITQENKQSSTPETTIDVSDSTSSAVKVPAGAIKEEFTDTPGVIKVSSPQEMGNYKNGKKEGSWVTYHSNGLVNSITSFVDGKKEGLYTELNSNGGLIKRCVYHNNLRHGEYKEFNYTMLKEERSYQFDKLEGVVKIFYDNGKVMEEGSYKNGTREGISKWYDQNGKMTISYEYKNGELIKK